MSDVEVIEACPDCGAAGFGNADCPRCHREWQGTWGHVPCAICAVPTPATAEIARSALERLAQVPAFDPMTALDALGPSAENGVALLAFVRYVRTRLGDAEEELVRFLADVLPVNQTIGFDGIGAATVRPGTQRKAWKHEELVPKVAEAIAERMGYPVGPIREVIDAWLSVASPSWKLGKAEDGSGLRGLGLDPDEFCEKSTGPKRVDLEVSPGRQASPPLVP